VGPTDRATAAGAAMVPQQVGSAAYRVMVFRVIGFHVLVGRVVALEIRRAGE